MMQIAMRNRSMLLLLGLFVSLIGCRSSGSPERDSPGSEIVSSMTVSGPDGMRLTSKVICQRHPPIQLTLKATSRDYGRSPEHPIQVAALQADGGPGKSCRYLNALRGPNGQEITFDRLGTCCAFAIPGRDLDGMLDIYEIWWDGAQEPVKLYLDFYRSGELLIPVGLRAAAE